MATHRDLRGTAHSIYALTCVLIGSGLGPPGLGVSSDAFTPCSANRRSGSR